MHPGVWLKSKIQKQRVWITIVVLTVRTRVGTQVIISMIGHNKSSREKAKGTINIACRNAGTFDTEDQ